MSFLSSFIRKSFLPVLALWAFCGQAQTPEAGESQAVFGKRVELPTGGLIGPSYRLSLPTANGFLVFNPLPAALNMNINLLGAQSWELRLYDENMEDVWLREIKVKNSLNQVLMDTAGNEIFVLFANYGAGRQAQLLRVNTRSKEMLFEDIEFLDRIWVNDFKMLGGKMFLNTRMRSQPVLFMRFIDAEGRARMSVLPTSFSKRTEITNFQKSTDGKLLQVGSVTTKGSSSFAEVKFFDKDGKQSDKAVFQNSDNRFYLDAKPSVDPEGGFIVAGTFGAKRSSYSKGFYVSRFKDGEQSYIKFYDFAQLNNFFEYLGDKKADKMEAKIQKRQEKGKKNNFNYRLLLHDIIKADGQNILIAEVYYPVYTYRTRQQFVNGRYMTVSQQVFDGYQYQNAFAAGLDQEGNLKWNTSFPLNQVRLMTLQEQVRVLPSEHGVQLSYTRWGKIRTKVVKNGAIQDGLKVVNVGGATEDDKVTRNIDTNIMFWGGGASLIYGTQRIKNDGGNEDEKNKRTVFFIQKMTF